MKFIKIKNKEDKYFKEAMELYKTSFPVFEQRTLDKQIEVLENKEYNFAIICDDENLMGILFYWEYDNFRYIEHFAIKKDLRGKSYGSKILKIFCESEKETILEIDPPIDDISIKRLKFYSKLGFKLGEFNHIHPPYRKEYQGHKLKIMSFNENLSKEEYEEFNRYLKEEVMKFAD
ncbi:GNAT family N-acetyltransferase [uncultured Clostridium sp.]|uniref:GNAT family N-acetyltransferase n=1 Tax=uncultured Clostridium sp. TaxID=59620 RepID=UPI002639107F|nr:GNAT family N-acetyltransferase [uncultured Clostridium sp.]